MLKIVLIVVAVVIAAVLAYAATRPDTFRVQRALAIQASAGKIMPLLDDFHNWGSWSPWEKLDPAMKRTFSGAPSGKGAVYAWDGNSKAGAGRMEILDASPSQVRIQLDFSRPFEGHNITEFNLVPAGGATNVTWAMQGPSPFMMKVMHVFMNMDRMVGKDFEAGLANLKGVAER
jgi:hypothetical protein